MNKAYHIERMKADEVQIAVDWAVCEGWNPGLSDAACFYQADPHGFFAGKLGNQIIAVASAVNYDDQFSFFGFYIVDKAYRDQGYGLALTQACLAYVGNRSVGLDGVISMLDRYERLGYRYAHNNARYCLAESISSTVATNPAVKPLANFAFDQILAYDRLHFPAPRPAFLQSWISQPGHVALGFNQNDQLAGYTVLRPCHNGYKIGPLFANTAEIALALFQTACQSVPKGPIFLDIPENNPDAVDLVNSFKMTKVFATARMYRNAAPKLPIANIFGITTFELG